MRVGHILRTAFMLLRCFPLFRHGDKQREIVKRWRNTGMKDGIINFANGARSRNNRRRYASLRNSTSRAMAHLFSIGLQRLGKSAAKGQCIIVEMPQTRPLTHP